MKELKIANYIIEQLNNFEINIINTITGQIVATWKNQTRFFEDDELYSFYEYWLLYQMERI